jgi:hypothetical protein
MKNKNLSVLALPLVLAFALAGCSSDDSSSESAPSSESSSEATTADETAAEETTDTDAAAGTRDNPAPAGDPIEVTTWDGKPEYTVTLGEITLDGNEQVAAAGEYNDVPEAGMQYIIIPVTYTYIGDESGTPWIDVSIEFVSAAGTTHTPHEVVALLPNATTDVSELYPDGTGSGDMAIMVPSADLTDGTLAVSSILSTDKIFVAIQ